MVSGTPPAFSPSLHHASGISWAFTDEPVVPGAPDQRYPDPPPPIQRIVARAPIQGVVPAHDSAEVSTCVARVAGEGKPGTECRRVHVQRRRAGRQPCRIGDHHALHPRDARRYHQGLPGGGAGEADHIRARPAVDHLARAVLCGSPDQEHIVPVPAVQRIVARPAVERVVARAAIQRVRAIRADQEIGAGIAGDSH